MGHGTLLQSEIIGFQNCGKRGSHQFYELSSEDQKLLDTSPSLFLQVEQIVMTKMAK